jgi:glycosyltransferase involved in cell wall biosynthesis
MRVLHSESSRGWGGQENRTLQEALQLRSRGVEMAFACQPGSQLAARAQQSGFSVTTLPMRNNFDMPAVARLAAAMRRHGADIVNTHSGRDTFLAGLGARLVRRRPLVVRTRHLILPITSRSTYTFLPDHVVAVSEAVRAYLMAVGVLAHRVTAIPTGVDTARFDPAGPTGNLRQELGLPAEAVLVGTVAILRAKKGHLDLLAAAPRVLAALPQVVFVFAGDGPQFDNLNRAIAERNLEGRVRLLGLQRDIPEVLRSLDLFVLPTHQEALGTSYLEAQAMAVPVIGTRVGGVPETIRENETGLLVPAHDPEALAQAIIALARDPARRRAMGAAGRAWVSAEHTVQIMGERMFFLYQRLLQERAGR